jgi:hypothetical protein
MTPSIVLDDAIFPKHDFSKQYKVPPDYYAAALGFPKRGQKSPYTTEKLLADIPRAPAPKNIPTKRYPLADPTRQNKHIQACGYQRQGNDISARTGQRSIAGRLS